MGNKNNSNISNGYIPTPLQKAYVRFLKIRGEPRQIALGFALGLFVGMTPFMGFHTVIAIFFAALLKWNKISAAIGVWITNPLTAPFIYSITYYVGYSFMGLRKVNGPPDEINYTILIKLLQKTPEVLSVLILGGIIIGIPLALIGYYFSFSAVLKYQEDIKKKLMEKKKRRKLKKKYAAYKDTTHFK